MCPPGYHIVRGHNRTKWISTKSLNKFLSLIILIFCQSARAVNGYIPLDKKHITLPDGREILAVRTGDHSHEIVFKYSQKIIWKKNFEQEYDRLWDHAFFVPIKKGRYSYDLDHSGYPKIAVATWDGGNAMDHRTVVIFEVKKDSLVYWGVHPFNLEYGKFVYP